MSREAYTETEIEKLLKDYIVQKFLYEESKADLTSTSPLIESGIINSLGTLTMVSFIEEKIGISIGSEEIVLKNFKDINSIKCLVLAKIGKLTQQETTQESTEGKLLSLLSIKPEGYKHPFFYIHGLPGYNLDANLTLARHIDPDRPFYGVQAIGVDPQQTPHNSISEMASHYIQEIQTVQAKSPYFLGGVSGGGGIAFEVAQQLQKKDYIVQLLVMVDTPNPYLTEPDVIELCQQVGLKMPSWGKEIDKFWQLNSIEHRSRLFKATLEAMTNYLPEVYCGRVVYFAAEEGMTEGSYLDPMQPQGWNSLVADGLEIHKIPGNHFTMHYEPHVRVLAEKLNASLEKADQGSAVQA